MPLRVMLVEHIADIVPSLEVSCAGCARHLSVDTADLVVQHGAFVSVPQLKQILASACPQGELHHECEVQFPQLERIASQDIN